VKFFIGTSCWSLNCYAPSVIWVLSIPRRVSGSEFLSWVNLTVLLSATGMYPTGRPRNGCLVSGQIWSR
jgi:hypothetical protein